MKRPAQWLVEAGVVLAAWTALLAVELLVVAVAHRGVFSGGWEVGLVATHVGPVALAAVVPLALLVPRLARDIQAAEHDARRRRVLALLAGAGAGTVAYGVSFGRHMASWAVRGPFVGVLGALAALVVWRYLPRAVAFARGREAIVARAGAGAALVAWCLDRWVLPRLYPAFHEALLGVAFAGGALVALPVRRWSSPARRGLGGAFAAAALACLVGALPAARRLGHADNVRVLLLERAPWLGRGVRVASLLAPPAPMDEPATATLQSAEAPRTFDWSGRDVVLLSVDALRADHVSSYGYPRRTTPNIDGLARQGVRFTTAYCATPHTSYSVTSIMTGKYMRPLLALGLGADSETWASHARRYGYRTAGFYPPAVFFIDEDRFAAFRDRGLDFEYRKAQFSAARDRAREVEAYLRAAPAGQPLFLWVHFFEPHEPYVMHDGHAFGAPGAATSLDAYDSEVAAADAGLGEVVRLVRARANRPVFVVTADHGEEFGEHGGRYHGTTVYDEQVHVPLVIAADDLPPAVVDAPVQTIDLLPTVLSQMGVPRPPRVRGRDLGPLLAGKRGGEGGLAFAETDDYARVVRGNDRLVCARAIGACRLFDGASDPGETRDRAGERPGVVREMRGLLAAIEREHGRFESGAGAELPEALRRGLQGSAEAAVDVAALLDDVRADIRRQAAAVLFDLRAADTRVHLERAMARDEDADVRKWSALALGRLGPPLPAVRDLSLDRDVAWRRRAALVRAEHGDGAVEAELAGWWAAEAPWNDQKLARELLAALAKIHARSAALVPALDDVRLRRHVVEAMPQIPNPAYRPALLATFAGERYLHLRPIEARALLAMGAREELRAPLERFAGVPEPMPGALEIAGRADLLTAERGGWEVRGAPVGAMHARLTVPKGRALRLLVRVEGDHQISGTIGGRPTRVPAPPAGAPRDLHWVDLPAEASGELSVWLGGEVDRAGGIWAVWAVPVAGEIPPPPPRAWDAGAAGELRGP